MMISRRTVLLILAGANFSGMYAATSQMSPKGDAPKAHEDKKEVRSAGSLQGGNIGVVNEMEAMQGSKKGAEVAKQLEAKRQSFTAELKKQEEAIKQAMNDYKAKEATMSAQARSAEEAKLQKKSREFEAAVKDKDEELKLAMQEVTQDLSLDVEKAVAEYAQAHGYTLIFGLYTGRVIYADPSAMVTADIVKAMDSSYKAAAKAPAPTTPKAPAAVA